MQTLLKVDEDDRDSIMIQEAIWEIFKTERSYMNGVQNSFSPTSGQFNQPDVCAVCTVSVVSTLSRLLTDV